MCVPWLVGIRIVPGIRWLLLLLLLLLLKVVVSLTDIIDGGFERGPPPRFEREALFRQN